MINWIKRTNPKAIAVVCFLGLVCLVEEVFVTSRALDLDVNNIFFYASERRLVLLMALSVLFFMHVGRFWFISYAVFNFIINIFIITYCNNIGNPPLLMALMSSWKEGVSLGFAAINYVPIKEFLILSVSLFVKIYGIKQYYKLSHAYSVKYLIAVCACILIATTHIYIYRVDQVSIFHISKLQDYHPSDIDSQHRIPALITAKRYGLVGTWLGELISHTYNDIDLSHPTPAVDVIGSSLPVFPLASKIIMIQVESLDYDLLDFTYNGRMVTPYLNNIAQKSIVLPVNMRRKVGSANSDYEVLCGNYAQMPVIYYLYLPVWAYQNSIISAIKNLGYQTSVFVGNHSTMFSLGRAYKNMGFNNFCFEEDMLPMIPEDRSGLFTKINDKELFAKAAQQLHTDEKQMFFMVTMTMHPPFDGPVDAFGRTTEFQKFLSAANFFDQALKDLIEQLPDDSLVFIWGDHFSGMGWPGNSKSTNIVPFIIYLKGKNIAIKWNKSALSSLCEISPYLQKIFGAVVD